DRRLVDDVRVVELLLETVDPCLEQSLRLTLAVVFGVLAEVPLRPGIGDFLRDLGHLDVFQLANLFAKLVETLARRGDTIHGALSSGRRRNSGDAVPAR